MGLVQSTSTLPDKSPACISVSATAEKGIARIMVLLRATASRTRAAEAFGPAVSSNASAFSPRGSREAKVTIWPRAAQPLPSAAATRPVPMMAIFMVTSPNYA